MDATRTNPDKPHVFNKWPGLTNEVYKTPTVLLIDPDGNLEAFGQEALNKYYNKRSLKFPDRFDDYYFFRNFKMVLYDKQVSTLCTCQFQVPPPCILYTPSRDLTCSHDRYSRESTVISVCSQQ